METNSAPEKRNTIGYFLIIFAAFMLALVGVGYLVSYLMK